MKTHLRRSATLLAAVLAFAACSAGAQNATDRDVPLYQVEIIVFAHRTLDPAEEYFDQARLPTAVGTRPPQRREPFRYEDVDIEALLRQDAADRAVQPEAQGNAAPETGPETQTSGDPPPFGFRRLRPEELQLGSAHATLVRLSAYEPLLHTGWVQEGLPENQARAFDLQDLGRFNPSGTIQLHVSRFLHLRVNLTYQPEPVGDFVPRDGSFELSEVVLPPRYVLREDRRVTRSGELHYFDHPAFGVLVMIRPQPRQAAPPEDGVPRPAA